MPGLGPRSRRSCGAPVVTVEGSVGNADVADTAVRTMIDAFGRCDVVVNNAAINPVFGPLMDADLGAVTKVFDANITEIVRDYVPHVLARRVPITSERLSTLSALVNELETTPNSADLFSVSTMFLSALPGDETVGLVRSKSTKTKAP